MSGRLMTNVAGVSAVPCGLEYDAADPWAVTLVLWAGSPDPVVWVFGRELLADPWHTAGITDGCVTVSLTVDEDDPSELWVRIDLVNPRDERHAVVLVPQRVVDAFLAETYRLVPAGTEEHQVDWDPTLRSWTDGGRAA